MALTRLKALRDELGREPLSSYFSTADELGQLVMAAIDKRLG